ncbi:MAG: hypothetical protein PHV06_09240, partial [bacterium]|nr:hypothetical protein [bacterium]
MRFSKLGPVVLVILIGLVQMGWGISDEEESFRLYVSGINNIDEGRFDLAIQDFNDALELKSNSASYCIARAIAYGKTGKYHLGIDDL